MPNLVPVAKRKKLYDLKDAPVLAETPSDKNVLIVGAGAAPWTFLNRNAEVELQNFFTEFFNKEFWHCAQVQ